LGCGVYVPNFPPKGTMKGPQRRYRIYIEYDSPLIIKYFELSTGDLFTIRFVDYNLDKIFQIVQSRKYFGTRLDNPKFIKKIIDCAIQKIFSNLKIPFEIHTLE